MMTMDNDVADEGRITCECVIVDLRQMIMIIIAITIRVRSLVRLPARQSVRQSASIHCHLMKCCSLSTIIFTLLSKLLQIPNSNNNKSDFFSLVLCFFRKVKKNHRQNFLLFNCGVFVVVVLCVYVFYFDGVVLC